MDLHLRSENLFLRQPLPQRATEQKPTIIIAKKQYGVAPYTVSRGHHTVQD